MYEEGIYERIGAERWRQARRRKPSIGWRDWARVGGLSGAIAGAPLVVQAYGEGSGAWLAGGAWLALCLIIVLIGFKPRPRRYFAMR